jgi:hypothetical protein
MKVFTKVSAEVFDKAVSGVDGSNIFRYYNGKELYKMYYRDGSADSLMGESWESLEEGRVVEDLFQLCL